MYKEHFYVSYLHLVKNTCGVITKLMKMTKPKYGFGHFQVFCDNSTLKEIISQISQTG